MMNLFGKDIQLAIYAMEDYIINQEQSLIDANAGEEDWTKLLPMKQALENFKLLGSIYGT